MAASGTLARIACALPRGSRPSTRPRRELRSPITSPRYSSGVTTSTAITGSSSFGLARCIAFLKAIEQAVDDDLQVQLAHPGDERLPGLVVRPHTEGRILFGQALETRPELVLVALRLRLDCDRDHRLREGHRLEADRRRVDRERVAGRRRLQPDDGRDLARPDLGALLTVVRVHLEDAPDPLALAGGGVHDPVALDRKSTRLNSSHVAISYAVF